MSPPKVTYFCAFCKKVLNSDGTLKFHDNVPHSTRECKKKYDGNILKFQND